MMTNLRTSALSSGMRTLLLVIALVVAHTSVHAQIGEIPLPAVDTLAFRITQRVYMSPNGNDSSDGTRTRPLKTFASALRAVPWPASGNAYAEIVLLPGTYHDRFVQSEADYRRGAVTRNISMRGEGRVVLDGTGVPLNGVEGVVTLRGSHISIRNVHVVSSLVAGITAFGPATDVLIDACSVDTAISHGIYFDHIERGSITNSSVREAAASMLGQKPRSFGSAIKLYLSKDLTVRNCISQRNWGEGVNVNRTERCLVEGCTVGDNYGIAFYLDMAAVCVIRNNRILYDIRDTSHWAADRPASGISLSNELTCYANSQCDAIWTGTDNCRYHCQGIGCEFWVRMNDSCFIYNNLIVNAGTGLELFELFNIDCFRTIEFTHNTIVGSSRSGSGAMVWFNLGMLIHAIENITVRNNLFLMDDASIQAGTPMCRYGENPTSPVRQNITVQNNAWNRPPLCALASAADTVIDHAVPNTDSTRVVDVDPSVVGDVFGRAPSVSYVRTDIQGRPRRPLSSIGAMEGGGVAGLAPDGTSIFASLAPMPASDEVLISVGAPSDVWISDLTGRIYYHEGLERAQSVDLAAFPPGLYTVRVVQAPYIRVLSLCIVR